MDSGASWVPMSQAQQQKKPEKQRFKSIFTLMPKSETPATILGEGKPTTVVNNTKIKCVQRKGDNIPLKLEIAESSIEKDSLLKTVLDEIDTYHNAGEDFDNDYGMQICQLKEISEAITLWEKNRNDNSNQETANIRKELDKLKEKIEQENKVVKGQGFTKAKTEHEKDRDILENIVKQGRLKSKDIRMSFSGEWMKEGRAKLYAVTPTGDSYARVENKGKKQIYTKPISLM